MNIALITNKNTYSGREFLGALSLAGINVDVITIGEYPSFSKHEEKRCQGKWNPPLEVRLREKFSYYDFDSLQSGELVDLLNEKNYDLGLQGGTDKIKPELIEKFAFGMLNFHPGKLPEYRGCSSAEWQVYEGNPVVCTCHFVNEGIDTGDIYTTKVLTGAMAKTDYFSFRAAIYPEISQFVVEVISEILANGHVEKGTPQFEDGAIYRSSIGEEQLILVKNTFPEKCDS